MKKIILILLGSFLFCTAFCQSKADTVYFQFLDSAVSFGAFVKEGDPDTVFCTHIEYWDGTNFRVIKTDFVYWKEGLWYYNAVERVKWRNTVVAKQVDITRVRYKEPGWLNW